MLGKSCKFVLIFCEHPLNSVITCYVKVNFETAPLWNEKYGVRRPWEQAGDGCSGEAVRYSGISW